MPAVKLQSDNNTTVLTAQPRIDTVCADAHLWCMNKSSPGSSVYQYAAQKSAYAINHRQYN